MENQINAIHRTRLTRSKLIKTPEETPTMVLTVVVFDSMTQP
jgi:hypothetical protein